MGPKGGVGRNVGVNVNCTKGNKMGVKIQGWDAVFIIYYAHHDRDSV